MSNLKNVLVNVTIGNVGGNFHVGDVTIINLHFADGSIQTCPLDEIKDRLKAELLQEILEISKGKDFFQKVVEAMRPPKYLTSPPFNPPFFIGRETELQEVHDRLFGGDNFLMLVNGQGGIGKTTFAAKYWERYEGEYHHLAFLYVEGGIADALLRLANGLGLQFTTETIAQQLDILITTANNLAKPCLLVLDNANDHEDLERNIYTLRKCPNFHILMTSRVNKAFEGATQYKVDVLKDDFPLQLFKQHYPKHRETENGLFWDFFALIQGNTLVIEVLAKNLQEINQEDIFYTLHSFLGELQTKGLLRLSEQEKVKVHWRNMEKAEPAVIIEAMYDLRPLPEDELQMLSVFAVLPAENIHYDTLITLLSPANVRAFANVLSRLSAKGWIEKTPDGEKNYYKTSPVIQDITRHKNKDRLFTDCEGLMGKLIDLLAFEGIHLTGSSYQDALLYSRYAERAVDAFEGEAHHTFSMLLDRVGRFYETTGNLWKALELYDRLKRVCEELHMQDVKKPDYQNSLAIAYSKLGETHLSLGDLQVALRFFEKETTLSEHLHRAYPDNMVFTHGLAIAYEKLGDTHSRLGDLKAALSFFEEYHRLSENLHHAYPDNVAFANGLAVSLEKLGSTHSHLGDLQAALRFFEEQTILSKHLHHSYLDNVAFTNSLAIAYEKLGETHSHLGDLQAARRFFEEETTLFETLRRAYPDNVAFTNSLAIAYSKLGDTHSRLGDLQAARRFFEEYHRLSETLHRADNVAFTNSLAIAYSKLGETHSHLGDLQAALRFFEEYHRLSETLHRTYPDNVAFTHGLAISYMKFYFLFLEMEQAGKAKENLEKAVHLFEQLARDCPAYPLFKQQAEDSRNRLQGLQ